MSDEKAATEQPLAFAIQDRDQKIVHLEVENKTLREQLDQLRAEHRGFDDLYQSIRRNIRDVRLQQTGILTIQNQKLALEVSRLEGVNEAQQRELDRCHEIAERDGKDYADLNATLQRFRKVVEKVPEAGPCTAFPAMPDRNCDNTGSDPCAPCFIRFVHQTLQEAKA